MAEHIPFINRESELALIEKLVGKWGTRRILCINAPGGVGKTCLLQQIHQRYTGTKRAIGGIVDFDDRTLHLPHNLAAKIAQILSVTDENIFAPYFHVLRDRHGMELSGYIRVERLEQENLTVNRTFIECFNAVSDEKRVVLLMDTTDALDGMDIWKFILELEESLKNNLFLIAGRNAKEIGEFLRNQLGDEDVEIIELLPLEVQASESYLQQKQHQLHRPIEPELAQKLIFLASGRPILLDLAVEWLMREIPFDWLATMSLKELLVLPDDTKVKRQREFESRLVHHIADTRQTMDWLMLVMSRTYPLNVDMISKLLTIHANEAKRLFKEAQNYVFVKQLPDGRISLHDEVRRMVNEYVWPEVDPDGDRRRLHSKLSAEYLEREVQTLAERIKEFEIEELELKGKNTREEKDAQMELDVFMKREPLEREIWVLKSRKLGHILFTDIDKGVRIFANIFDEATQAYRYAFRNSLLVQVQKYENQLSIEQQYEVTIRRVKYLLDDGQYPQARELLIDISTRADLQPEQQIDTRIQRANVEIRLGKLLVGIKFFQDAVEISEKHHLKEWLMKSATGLGWGYRLTDDFNKAHQFYQMALDLAKELKAKEDQVRLHNNMGFVYAYLVDIPNHMETAVWFCEQALSLAEKIKDVRGQGMVYSTLGCIRYMAGEFEKALNSFQQSIEIFEPARDRELLSIVYSWRGALYMAQGNADEAEKELQKSLDMNIKKDLPLNLARLAHIHISKNELDEAEKKIYTCRQLAMDLPDVLYQQVSLRDMSRLALIKKEYDRREEFERLLADYREKWGEPKDLRALGMLYLNLGCLALGQSNLTSAVEHFKLGLKLLAREGLYAKDTPQTFVTRLEQVMVKDLKLSSESIREIGSKLLTFWQKEGFDVKYGIIRQLLSKWATWEEE